MQTLDFCADANLEFWCRWVEYAKAKDEMFRHTDTNTSPWVVVPSDDKKARPLPSHAFVTPRSSWGPLPLWFPRLHGRRDPHNCGWDSRPKRRQQNV